MPLLKYFTTIGLLLTALLLLADALREPRSAALRETARREADLPKPRIYSRVGERAVNIPQTATALATQARSAPTAEVPRPLSESTAEQSVGAAPEPPAREATAAPDAVKKAKPRKTAKVRAQRHNNDVAGRHLDSNPAYLSYAQERRGWPFFPQTNPRTNPTRPFFAQGGITRPSFAQGGGRWN